MDQTPGGKDESAVVEAQRLGEEVDVERRVQLLISFTTQVVFGYVAQVWSRYCHISLHVCTHPCQLNRKQTRLSCCSYSCHLSLCILLLGTACMPRVQIWKASGTAGLATDNCMCECRVCLNATS